MEKIGERLSYLVDSTGLNKSQFAKKYGFTDSALRSMCSGDKPIGLKIAKQLVDVFPTLNLNWFFFNTGPVNYINSDINSVNVVLQEPEEKYNEDVVETMFLSYLGRVSIRKKIMEIINLENNKNYLQVIDELKLSIEVGGEENSELIDKLENIIKRDIASHKLPIKNKNVDTIGDAE